MDAPDTLRLAQALTRIAQSDACAEQGAEQIFRLLWRKYVNDYVRSGQALAQAEDLASSALQKILSNLEHLRDPVAFLKWANTIARNTLFTHLRDTKDQREHEVALDAEPLEAIMQSLGAPDQMDALTRYCLQSQLEKFCQTYPERAHWLERWIMHGDSLHDISAALGRTTAASKEYLSQCRQRLQQHLKQCLTH